MAHYFNIGLDSPVSAFDICQAHAQLESDYNVGGWLRERESNRRRRESTGCQLARVKFNPGMRWVDIYQAHDPSDDSGDEDVRDIYIRNVLRWRLPITESEKAFVRARYVPEFLAQYPWVLEPGDFIGPRP